MTVKEIKDQKLSLRLPETLRARIEAAAGGRNLSRYVIKILNDHVPPLGVPGEDRSGWTG